MPTGSSAPMWPICVVATCVARLRIHGMRALRYSARPLGSPSRRHGRDPWTPNLSAGPPAAPPRVSLPLTVGLTIEAATEATPELEQGLAALMPQLNPALAGPTREALIAVLADPATTLLVARQDMLIVATATVIVYTTPAWTKARIEDLVVDEGNRGHG